MKIPIKNTDMKQAPVKQILIFVPIDTASAGFEFVYKLKFFPSDSLWGTFLNQ